MTKSNQKTGYHHGDLKRALLDETARILRAEGEDALYLRRLAASIKLLCNATADMLWQQLDPA